ncbi:FHA domain-containing protein [Bdellovibrio svalbardensis]|uniref:FHA domain-containing protein n=1 Tax=Bdellovibrio svalbardensis TaxID=2972972 RepID=A0ABT6DKM3_9BACT|nr:FHA domain-containing protein [Bdellovibrio svalbardensis]MDG0817067.1 FHA domain-containing protein [Bdellovibrio svalbardensis]
MWALRVLTGPQAGQILELKMGRNVIGRAPTCDIKITSAGVSKEHTEVTVYKEKIVITDLKSSNGTFLNGIRMQTGIMRLGDKLGIHDVLADVIPAPDARAQAPRQQKAPTPYYGGGAAPQMPPQMYQQQQYTQGMPQPMAGMPGAAAGAGPAPAPAYHPGGMKAVVDKVMDYIDKVALPGVYKLPTYIEFKMVLLGFVVLFIFMTTLLSMIPMVAISRASIINESKRRAASIARTVATMNQSALLQNSFSTLTTNQAESEDGVKQVLIVQQADGMILAPATRAGTTPDLPFVHVARREMRPQSVEVDSSTIGASFPIGLFDPNTGEQSVKAHAIVLYDIGSLAFDDGRAISLFMQTLVIATLVGLLVFFFMYKLIEYPIASLNSQLDVAMREKKDSTEVDFMFPPLQALIGNINSLLTRYVNGARDEGGAGGNFVNKDAEAENLVQMIGFPAVAIAKDGRLIACSPSFAQVAHSELSALLGQMYTAIPDAALQQNIEHLVGKSRENSRVIHTDQLEFSGHLCILSCQAMSSSPSDVDYYLITVSPTDGGS